MKDVLTIILAGGKGTRLVGERPNSAGSNGRRVGARNGKARDRVEQRRRLAVAAKLPQHLRLLQRRQLDRARRDVFSPGAATAERLRLA